MAAFESVRIGERVASTVKARADAGRHHSQWPYGFDKDGNPTEPQAGVVRRIYQESAAGKSQLAIAKALNADKIKTAKGKAWSQSQIKRILSNVTYCGQIESNGTVHDGKHLAIVSAELFERVQKLRAANRRDSGGQARGRHPKAAYLFTKGLLRCAHCGEAMTYNAKSYVCASRKQRGTGECIQANIPQKLLDSAVFEFFKAERFDAGATREALETRVNTTHKQRTDLLAEALRDETKARENLERMKRQVKDGEITPQEWREDWKSDVEGELAAAIAKREGMEQAAAAAQSDVETVSALAESAAIQGLASIQQRIAGEIEGADGVESVRAALATLFERFELARAPKGEAIPDGFDAELDVPMLSLSKWTVALYPRTEWQGDLDGYWREIVERVPLTINEHGTTLEDCASQR